MSPERYKDAFQPGTLIVMSERVRFICASYTEGVIMFFIVKSVQCRAYYRGFEGNQQVTQDKKHAKQFSCGAGCQQHDDD